MKLSVKFLKEQLAHINEFCLSNSVYQLRLTRAYSYYHIYLARKDEASRTIKLLYVGNAREVNAYFTALQMQYWYMQEPF